MTVRLEPMSRDAILPLVHLSSMSALSWMLNKWTEGESHRRLPCLSSQSTSTQ
jgi:hypothetical protein